MSVESEVVDRGDFLVEEEPVEEGPEGLEEDNEDLPEEEEGDEVEEDLEEDSEDPVEGDEDYSEEDEEDEEPEEPEDSKGNARVPQGRLNQVVKQRDEERQRALWLEEQLETLIKQQGAKAPEAPAPVEDLPEYDFDSAEDKYSEFLLEGSIKEAGAIRKEINQERDKIYQHQIAVIKAEAAETAKSSATASIEGVKFEAFLEETFSNKPYLDDSSDEYNERAVKMANSLMSSYVSEEGLSRVEALSKAVADIAPLFEKAQDQAPPKETGKRRAKAARKKAVSSAEKQPPTAGRRSGGKAPRDLDKIDIGKMSERDFNSLSKKELAVLRGDI